MQLLTSTVLKARSDFCTRNRQRFNCQIDRERRFVYSMAARLWEECLHGMTVAEVERTKAAAEVSRRLIDLLPAEGTFSLEDVRAALSVAISSLEPLR